ncbi:autotransporter outer membrane beta-barrel domain-containing protein [Achromobacter animicus]|uniref:autotransporter outer membrane beta-barrel domain-containing protein n=1 Tax=Achromobacter animicus TaxID=1389935 RepID=UPI0028B217C9|nr:autotransporter outer membrane beta-barrel domain-containing protein [Achromobacter animicus]
MHFPLSPIVAAILAAAVPTIPLSASAAPIGPIVIDDTQGNTSLVLEPGTTITVSTGDAINVNHLGNSVTGNDISVIAEGDSRGVHAQGGGAITLTDSTVQTQDGTAVWASMVDSLVNVTNTDLSSTATTVLASDSGRIELTGGSVSSSGGGLGTIRAVDGGVIVASDLEVTSFYSDGNVSASLFVLSGASVDLSNVTLSMVSDQGVSSSAGISVHDAELLLTDSTAGHIDLLDSAATTIQGSTVSSVAVWNGGSFKMTDSVLATLSVGLLLNGPAEGGLASSASLINVTIGSEAVPVGYAVVVSSHGVLVAQDVDIHAQRYAIDNHNGSAYLHGGTLRGDLGGLKATPTGSYTSTIEAVGTTILAEASGSIGVIANRPGAQVSLNDVTVNVSGNARLGLQVTDGAHLDAANSQVHAQADGSTGLQIRGNADSGANAVSLSNTKVIMAGQGANAVDSLRYEQQDANALLISNGSDLQTHDGVGFLVRGANHEITVENSQVLARSGGSEAGGVLLHTQAAPAVAGGATAAVETETVTLHALGAVMTGDVMADSGRVNVRLANGSSWTGAVLSGQGVVDSVSALDGSAWNVRGDSALKTLKNAGFVQFVAPDAQTGFKTLTVSDYIGGGTLVMNTQLGDDTSLTDKLIIDGGAVTGSTGLRIMNAAGTGALTTLGIQLVQAVNGATIAADAFHLDEGSTGFRSTSSTLGLNGYEYFLVQGGAGGVASDWYLTSAYLPEEGGTTDPGGGETLPPGSGSETPPGSGTETPPGSGTETPPATPPGSGSETQPGSGSETLPESGTETPPGSGSETPPASGGSPGAVPGNIQNISPETGVHIGNQFVATRMFVHRLADRATAQSSATQARTTNPSRQVWARTEGARQTDLRLTEGAVNIDTDTAMLQMGADLLSTRLGQQGVLKAGVMAGAGDARTNATSQLIHPGTGMAMRVDARGKVTGYSVGIYATAYADDATRLGAYADSWLQFGRYSNEINSELGSARYRSNTWTASVETGYAFKPFAGDSALGSMVVVPQAQLAYTRYNAQDAVLPSMTLKNSPASSVTSRVGVRAYPLGNDAATSPVRPYVEANWLHSSGTAKANVGASTFHATPMRDAAELRVGVTGNVRESLQVTGELFGQAGNGGQRGYGGMLNVGYRW